jgi:hypothetical protein
VNAVELVESRLTEARGQFGIPEQGARLSWKYELLLTAEDVTDDTSLRVVEL